MNTRTVLLSLVTLSLVAGCAAQQRPASFMLESNRPDPVADLVRALAANGQQAEIIDPASGVIHTTWQDTGFLYGKIQNVDATIVRRFTVTVQQGASGNIVTVRQDGKRCAQYAFQFANGMVQGTCEVMNGVVPSHQEDVDNLAASLQSSLGPVTIVTQ